MKVLLLAGGFGSRLRPLTNHIPKCLVPIAGKPLLQYWLEALDQLPVTRIYINTHYLAEAVNQFIETSPWREKVTLIHESNLLGTLGTVRHYRDHFDTEATLIAHADNFCLTDWQQFVATFGKRPATCHLTLMLFRTATPWSCGMVQHTAQGVLSAYTEKPADARHTPEKYGDLANAAVMLVDQNGLNAMQFTPESGADLCRDFLPLQVGKANVYINDTVHIDIGTPETHQLANVWASTHLCV